MLKHVARLHFVVHRLTAGIGVKSALADRTNKFGRIHQQVLRTERGRLNKVLTTVIQHWRRVLPQSEHLKSRRRISHPAAAFCF
jgi:hypothetical protein